MKYGRRFCESRPCGPNEAGRLAIGLSGDRIWSILKGSFVLLGELGGQLMMSESDISSDNEIEFSRVGCACKRCRGCAALRV